MEKIVRLAVTPEQHRALKVLAAESDQSMQELLTAAVETSPLTARAMTAAATKGEQGT